jgi:flagellar biosynthesis protein FlhG
MKGIHEQSYYEILEVNPNATSKEIQMAYERARETFQSDSIAVYSLFTEDEIKGVQGVIDEAYRVLMDENLRRHYDEAHGGTWEKSPEIQGTLQEKKGSPSFTELAVQPEEEVYRGKTLREIRERMGIDLKNISKETKINLKILEWIEDEAMDRLPALVYLKGFLKGYAQSLGIDPLKVIDGYMQFVYGSKKNSPG